MKYEGRLYNADYDIDDVVATSWKNNIQTKSESYIGEKEQLHREICNGLHELYVAKNHDYGDSVHDTYIKYGLTSFLVRMEDKLNRIRTLNNKSEDIKVKDEKIEDTLRDLANYAIIALVELKSDKENN